SYHVFAGKDASKGLGMSSVKPEDAVPDYSGLDEAAMKTLDGWYEFFQCINSQSIQVEMKQFRFMINAYGCLQGHLLHSTKEGCAIYHPEKAIQAHLRPIDNPH
ncbi:17036_t:CDS:2, partial [Acaulospora colombiana]